MENEMTQKSIKQNSQVPGGIYDPQMFLLTIQYPRKIYTFLYGFKPTFLNFLLYCSKNCC